MTRLPLYLSKKSKAKHGISIASAMSGSKAPTDEPKVSKLAKYRVLYDRMKPAFFRKNMRAVVPWGQIAPDYRSQVADFCGGGL